MAELNFFATETDHEAIVSILISEYRCVFVADGLPPPLRELSTLSAVLGVLKKAKCDPRFFVLSPTWQHEPLSVHTITKGGKVLQYIRSRYGGPAFDYLACRPRRIEGSTQIVASWFTDYPIYYSEQPSGEIARPVAMSAAFRAVRRCVNRGGKRTLIQEIQKPGPIAMVGAREAHNTGGWLRVGDWHHVPKTGS